jgi:O-antigen/teichoic acid export membrane protein
MSAPIENPPVTPVTDLKKSGWFGNLLAYFRGRLREHNAAFLFTGASVLVSFGSMLAGAMTMRWISVEDRGLWSLARTAIPFAMFALAGVNNGLSRELPYFFGKADEEAAKRLAGTTVFYIRAMCSLVLLGGVGSLFWFRERDSRFLIAIGAVTGLIMLNFYTNYLIVTFRSSKSFRDFAKIKIGEAILTMATIPLIAYFGYGGMVARTLLLAGIVLLLMHLWRPVHVRSGWDKGSFLLLLKTGAPIFVFDYLITNASNCDQWILQHFGGLKMVGYFYLATMARDAVNIVPGALSEYIYPRMSFMFGKNHDPRHLWRMAVKSALLVTSFMVPVVIGGWFLLPPVVTNFFPKYVEAVSAAQWMLLACLFSGAMIGKMAIWSMKDWKTMAWYQVLFCVFIVGGPLLGAMFGSSALIGVAVGSLIARALWLPVGCCLVYFATHRTRPAGEPAKGL